MTHGSGIFLTAYPLGLSEMPERLYFHNRRSLTCGEKTARHRCLKGRTIRHLKFGEIKSPAFQADIPLLR
jgi:hypothetical protein